MLFPALDVRYSESAVAEESQSAFKEILKSIKDVIEQRIKSPVYEFRGIEYLEKGMWDEAIVEFNKVIEINPNVAEAYLGF